MDTARLRQATQAEHAATEDAVPLMRPTLSREEYVRVLQGFFRIVRAWDLWAEANVPADLREMLAERRHASLLAEDLRALGGKISGDNAVPLNLLQQSIPAGDKRSVFLGRMYVMEGSTLGGQLLARHVEQHLGLTPGEGSRYFRGYGEYTGDRWREFKRLLEALPEEESDTVIAAARQMFTLFRQSFAI